MLGPLVEVHLNQLHRLAEQITGELLRAGVAAAGVDGTDYR